METEERPITPLHVHVDDTTPVHVHVKKPKKPLGTSSRASDDKLHHDSKSRLNSSSNLRRSTATAKARSKSPGPWVPPPAKTTKAGKYSWQGPSHRLEISSSHERDLSPSRMQMNELDTDEEDKMANKMRTYEKKIDSLMSEVGCLKNEVDLSRSLHDMAKKDEMLESQSRIVVEKESELEDKERDLRRTELENETLRSNYGILKNSPSRLRSSVRDGDRDQLMKMLVEVELDGHAAAKQVAALKDITRRMRDGRLSASDASLLSKQRELLLERLTDFEQTNAILRRVLRERHEEEATSMCLAEQRDVLLKKLTETEDTNQKLRRTLLDKEQDVVKLNMQTNAQRDENVAMNGLQQSLESTRGHLQKQLRQKEADCNRMAVQVRALESQLAQERIDVDHLQELLVSAKEKAERDKEALKKATRVQKQRAAQKEDAVDQLNVQLLERDTQLTEVRSEMDNIRSNYDKVVKEKAQILSEKSAMKMRVTELEHIVERLEDESKAKVEAARQNSQEKLGEATELRVENDRLKTSLTTLEGKLSSVESEVSNLRGSVRHYETLVDEYRKQMNKLRQEADESLIQLEESKFETSRVKREGDQELSRLEEQADKVDHVRGQYISAQDQINNLESKVRSLEDKLQDVEDQNHTLMSSMAKKEETMHQCNMQLDEKSRENASISRQLETLLTDARRHSEQSRNKISERDRSNQARILELESQISQMRTDVMKVRREKDEAEKKFNARLYDIKDRLEQSHSTNRSMQNYVQFLKNSYAHVFGDPTVTATSSTPFRSTMY